ncbi:MAG: ASCH domain-containing protein [Mariprofundales bacterium]|nr:ASCH domain-containing protein [Mariprofundales bacterium]
MTNHRASAAMSDYPEKSCSIDRLIRHPKLVEAAIRGSKTEQRRDGVYCWPGERFTLNGVEFVCTELLQQRLGDMGDSEAQAEGFESLEAYRNLIMRMHKAMEWNPDALVWLHRFKRCDADGGDNSSSQ